ncbi:hypothetical protein ABG768_008161 [Culter alburnus]|uniref:Interleukin-12 subunit alpha n=1 Tax=Culter alburnus TaxID=194366 RepID=A0AAW1ZR45_CULAL
MKICAVFCVVVALAMGSPVPLNTQQCPCTSAARSLLSSLSHIMEKEGKMKHQDLFAGFNCTDLEARMIPHTQTASVCQPIATDNTSCSDRRDSSFSATECLRNIRGDLHYYDLLLNSYEPSVSNLSPVMTATKDLMHCLKANGGGAAEAEFPEWDVWSRSSFDDRLSLCKMLKGFHVRAITMNRALAYIASGDHRK